MAKFSIKEKNDSKKIQQLDTHTTNSEDKVLKSRQGIKVNDTNNLLKAEPRGATLLEDFLLREKISFDHERIAKRIVHARGSGAHGVLNCTKDRRNILKRVYLQIPKEKHLFCSLFNCGIAKHRNWNRSKYIKSVSV